ncbi:hypothetical protein BJ508DRAFT_409969 [Ascobolus immersus RN42]|uniref:Uncharacterized protein n=1 Tax=Ascobolus immersus RN42 TaxID=1160509 RepID=A0A3N4IPF2_ASCIM|nr:hypothetical protein BJ508DRAFT_409969 [Ascobolus immersus RN42]
MRDKPGCPAGPACNSRSRNLAILVGFSLIKTLLGWPYSYEQVTAKEHPFAVDALFR